MLRPEIFLDDLIDKVESAKRTLYLQEAFNNIKY